jgi:hypothetical protein
MNQQSELEIRYKWLRTLIREARGITMIELQRMGKLGFTSENETFVLVKALDLKFSSAEEIIEELLKEEGWA